MKKQIVTYAWVLAVLAGTLTACSESSSEATSVVETKYGVTLNMPLDHQNGVLSETKAVLTNVQTKQEYTATSFVKKNDVYVDSVTVPEGVYSIKVDGKISYAINGQNVTDLIKSEQDNVSINKQAETSHSNNVALSLNTYNAAEGFVISEIFFTGTLTPEGKQYSDDQYFKIANNSKETLYADGLAIVQTSFTTNDKQSYSPNLVDSAITVDAIYLIPGSGKDYPVEPGKEITIALNAINHKEYNSNSIDLSNADFEFYDELEDRPDADIDNKNVPNLINWYNNFASAFMLHNRGFKSYALVKPKVDRDTFNSKFKYEYKWTLVYGEYSFPMSAEGFFVPNSWVVDGVNLSVPAVWQWNVMSPSIDAGYTHCGQVDRDKTRYGKAVVRKKNGNSWIDTNNSTNDFEADAKPTLF